MAKQKNPQLTDITVKEGGALVHHHLLVEQVADLAREMERAGIPAMEISHSRGLGATKAGYPGLYPEKDLLEAARQAAPGLKLCVYIATYPYSLFEIEPLAPLFDIGRVGINIDEVEKGKEYVRRVKQVGKTAAAQLLRVHHGKPSEVAEAAKILAGEGADLIYLTDSYGSMDTETVRAYVEAVRKKVKVPLGFQAMNYTGRAVGNTLAAFEAGAEWLDAGLLGLGLGGGVTPLEILVAVLQDEGQCRNIDLKELTRAAKWQALPVLKRVPHPDRLHLLFAKHRIDFQNPILLSIIAEILEMDLEDFVLRLKNLRPGIVQLREADLREMLAEEKIDFDVLMEYLKTGQIPGAGNAAEAGGS
jgi:4-hydroxy 2-oxovalerate aldolase